jgi:hypothetical protein
MWFPSFLVQLSPNLDKSYSSMIYAQKELYMKDLFLPEVAANKNSCCNHTDVAEKKRVIFGAILLISNY